MRIALFSDNFYPELSGVSDCVVVLAKELAELGHQVDIYAPKYSSTNFALSNIPVGEIDLGKNIKVIRFSSFGFKNGTNQGRVVLPIGIRVFTILKNKPDVLHSQLFFGVGLEAMFAARILKRPIIGTNHTSFKNFLVYNPINFKWINDLLLKYMNWFYERCELVTAPSPSILKTMGEIGFKMAPGKMETRVVSNPIYIPVPISKDEREKLRQKLGMTAPTILYTGRFAKEKNMDILMDAVALVQKTIPDVLFFLVGGGSELADLTEQAKKLNIEHTVRFIGVLPKIPLREYYLAADIFASASISEVQSITMLEAMAAGLPFVGANVPGIAEHIHGENGVLAKPLDSQSLADKIIELLENAELRTKISRGAMEFSQQFSAKKIANEWEGIYKAVIESYHNRVG